MNETATIVAGALSGTRGKVVGYDSTYEEVTMRIDAVTSVLTKWDNIIQNKIDA